MRAPAVRRSLLLAALAAAVAGGSLRAQGTEGLVEYRHALPPTGFFRIWNPAGIVRVTSWEQDSVVVTGKVGVGAVLHCGSGATGAKCFVGGQGSDDTASGPAELDVRVPRLASVWVKSVGGDITLSAEGGNVEAYSVTGAIRVTGPARTVQVESMGGAIDLDVATEVLRARSGEGAIGLAGKIDDADVSSVTGTVRVTAHIQRGRVESIDGPMLWHAAPAPGARVDLISHGGRIDVRLPGGAGGLFAVNSYKGGVVCRGTGMRQTAAGAGRDISCTLSPDRDARFTIRNFKGRVLIARD